MGYDLHYAGSLQTLAHHDSYPCGLADAKERAFRSGRVVVIANAYDGKAYSVVRPDGSVSTPAES